LLIFIIMPASALIFIITPPSELIFIVDPVAPSTSLLHEIGVNLDQEDDAAGFLGVTLEQDPETGLLEMKQTGLIKRIIKAL